MGVAKDKRPPIFLFLFAEVWAKTADGEKCAEGSEFFLNDVRNTWDELEVICLCFSLCSYLRRNFFHRWITYHNLQQETY